MEKPLVSIICLCANHEKYVASAIESAVRQSYQALELIVVDDASTDNSVEVIQELASIHQFAFLQNKTNLGNCKSFNKAFQISKGAYIIDLAADDVLLPGRVATGVEVLEKAGDEYGVHFCDVELLNQHGKSKGTHYKRDRSGRLLEQVPSGYIYTELVEKYFISAPSMMMRSSVLEELNGYDEELSYEDFDFWVRSSHEYKYAFSDEVLVQKRILKSSLSSFQKRYKNKHAFSTAKVCQKAAKLNRTKAANDALLKRISYELKWALITENWDAANMLIELRDRLEGRSSLAGMEKLALAIRPPWYPLWKLLIS